MSIPKGHKYHTCNCFICKRQRDSESAAIVGGIIFLALILLMFFGK